MRASISALGARGARGMKPMLTLRRSSIPRRTSGSVGNIASLRENVVSIGRTSSRVDPRRSRVSGAAVVSFCGANAAASRSLEACRSVPRACSADWCERPMCGDGRCGSVCDVMDNLSRGRRRRCVDRSRTEPERFLEARKPPLQQNQDIGRRQCLAGHPHLCGQFAASDLGCEFCGAPSGLRGAGPKRFSNLHGPNVSILKPPVQYPANNCAN